MKACFLSYSKTKTTFDNKSDFTPKKTIFILISKLYVGLIALITSVSFDGNEIFTILSFFCSV